MEFFEKPNNQINCCEKFIGSDRASLSSTVDETDTMSTLSNNSLGEFLQSCQRPQIQTNNIEDIGPPPTKRNKDTVAILPESIKRELLENNIIPSRQSLPLFSADSVIGLENLKKEPGKDGENLNVVTNKNSLAEKICSRIDKTAPERRETDAAANNLIDSYNKSVNNEDLVPPTALFFKSDYQQRLKDTSNVCDYNEFYETTTNFSAPASTSLTSIKTESSYVLRGAFNSTENCENTQLNKLVNRNSATYNTLLSKENLNSNATTTLTKSFVEDGDDNLVPPQNLLGTYRPSPNVIKQEPEHDDIFSVPFNKRNQLNENIYSDVCNDMDSVTCQSNNIENATNVSEDYDDGKYLVIIIFVLEII